MKKMKTKMVKKSNIDEEENKVEDDEDTKDVAKIKT